MAAKTNPAVFMVADLLISSILLVTIFLLYFLATPYQRGFYCNDETIKYPYVEATLNDIAVVVSLLGVPIAVFGIIELVTSEGREPLVGNVKIPKGVLRWFDVTSTYLFGAGISEITCDSAKYLVGRLRPHFIDVCQPDVTCDIDAIVKNKYVTDYTCRGTDQDRIDEARLSFPSGFSAFSFYAAVYTIIYLQYNYKWNSAKVIRHLLQFALMMAAWFMALSRVSDHSAHWSDVLAGMTIGTLSATLTVVCVSDLKKFSKVRQEEEENRREIE